MKDRDHSNRYRDTVSAEEAESLLQPLLTDLMAIHQEVLVYWQKLVADSPRLGLDDVKNQARARVMSNSIASEVKKKFTGKDGIAITEELGFVAMVIKNKIAVRFKKLDRRLRPSNIRTKQQNDFSTQALLPGFPPEATNLTFGYKLNVTGTDIEGYWLQCPRGDWNLWSIPLDRPEVQSLFTINQPEPVEPAPPIVRPKKSSSKKAAE